MIKAPLADSVDRVVCEVSAFRERPLDAGPYTVMGVDALTVKVREDGRVVNVHALVTTGSQR